MTTAVLPGMSAAVSAGDRARYAASWRQALSYAVTAALPILCLLVAFAGPVAGTLAVGELRDDALIASLTVCIAVLGVSQLVAGVHEVGREARFVDLDVRGPQLAGWAAFAVTVGGGVGTLLLPAGLPRLAAVCVVVLLADLVAAASRRPAGAPRDPARAGGRRAPARRAPRSRRPRCSRCWSPAACSTAGEGHPLRDVVGAGAVRAAGGRRVRRDPVLAHRPAEGSRVSAPTVVDAPALVPAPAQPRAVPGRAACCAARAPPCLVLGAVVAGGGSAAVLGPLGAAGRARGGPVRRSAPCTRRRRRTSTWARCRSWPGSTATSSIPLVRPNEALLALLLAGAATGGYLRFVRGDAVPPAVRPARRAAVRLRRAVDRLAGVLAAAARPPAGRRGPGRAAARVQARALLVLVRLAVRTPQQMVRLARVIIWPAVVVAVIAILQTLGFAPLIGLLDAFWNGDGSDVAGLAERGTTTFASPIATGDYLVLSLALLVALGVRHQIRRREVFAAALVLLPGVLAAGQFSTWASAAVVGAATLYLHPRLRRRVLRMLPLLAVAALAGTPALVNRLSQFGDGFTVPPSWLGRWDNLVSFYLPGLGDFRWVLGVSPNSVLPAPETWREVIYMEYGYLQFLWVGGLPLLAGFVWLTVAVLRHARRVAADPGPAGAYGAALWAGWWMILVLSLIDIHLVLRGTGELIFVGPGDRGQAGR